MKDPTLYVPSHAGIWTNRKFVRLARRLATSELIVFACLHSLWHAAAAQSADGSLKGWDDIDVATAARWPADAFTLVESLVAEGWLSRSDSGALSIHDWKEYAGDWREKRDAARDRKRKSRELATKGSGGHCDSGVTGTNVTGQLSEANPSSAKLSQAKSIPSGEHIPAPEQSTEQGAGDQALPSLPPSIRVGPVRMPHTPRAGTLVGLNEEQFRPKTPDEVMERYATQMRERFPSLSAKRSVLRAAISSRMTSFTRKFQADGSEPARDGLLEWLEDAEAKQARKSRFGETQSAPYDENDPAQKRAWKVFSDEKRKGGDLPPFAEWFPGNAWRFTEQTPAAPKVKTTVPDVHPSELMDPAEVKALLRGATRRGAT
jgi:hypothetical protein